MPILRIGECPPKPVQMPDSRPPSRRPRSIQGLLVALVVGVAAPLVALQVMSSYREYDLAIESAEREALALAAATSVGTQQFLAVTEQVMRGVSDQFGPALLRSPRCDGLVGPMNGVFTFLVNSFVLDAEGQVACSAEPMPDGATSFAARGWFQRALHTGDFTVGSPDFASMDGTWSVTLAVPILDGSGDVVGVLAGGVALGEFQNLLAGVPLQSDELVTVVTQDGVIVARSLDSDAWVGRQITFGDGIERAWGRFEISGVGWLVHVGIPAERAFGSAILAARERAWYGLVIFLLTVLLAASFHRRIAGSLRDLVEGTRSAIDGHTRAKSSERLVRARYQSVFDNAVFGIYVATREGRFLEVNPALVTMLGFSSADELLATDLPSLYQNRSQRDELVERYRDAVIDQLELEWVRADGRPIVVRLNGKGIRTEADEPAYEVIVEDVTEEKRREDELRQTQKMEAVGRLAGGIAHDFNNLLTVIGGNIELLQGGLDEDDPLQLDVEQIVDATDRAVTLTRQLLSFSRKDPPESGTLDLNAVLSNLKMMLVRLIGEDIRLETRLSQRPQLVEGDVGQLEQVVMNLVINARDAMNGGGRITIETAVASESRYRKGQNHRWGVLLTIRDNGTGMDEETRLRIFEPFFTTKPKGEGTGLGLSTVYSAVRQAAGHIHVESELGRGTAFEIWFPAAEECVAQAADVGAEDDVPEAPAGGNETILAVEDEDLVRGIVRRVLEEAGYRVLMASDGHEALALSDAYPGDIDLLLTDVVMPRLKGAELAARLELRRPGTPVLFMSGYPDNLLSEDDLGLGGDAFLAKPFSPTDLSARVRRVLDERAAHRV